MIWFKLPQRSMLCGEYLEEPLGCLRSPQIAVIPAVHALVRITRKYVYAYYL